MIVLVRNNYDGTLENDYNFYRDGARVILSIVCNDGNYLTLCLLFFLYGQSSGKKAKGTP